MEKIAVALGGNALGYTPDEQKKSVEVVGKIIVDLVESGKKIIISHGNGPQVGMIKLAMDESRKVNERIPEMCFPECGAMSQGYIGYHIQNSIRNELNKRDLQDEVVSVVTQSLVDKEDPAFCNPTKPIGGFYSKNEAKIMENKGLTFIEDSGRGYRQVVASPMPKDVIEISVIKKLYDAGVIVIAGGGGGIPVIEKNGKLIGVNAVIDKDYITALMADKIEADILCILTSVDKVSINFGKVNQKDLDKLTIAEAKKYINNGEFGEGSMLPKVEAGIKFVEKKKDRKVLITSLYKVNEAFEGKTGTWIIN